MTTTLLVGVCIQLAVLATVCADLYVHVPRGSNNRLRETSAARNNANRLFDSQNNNRGGYNVGDKSEKKATSEDEQYRMKYFQSVGAATEVNGKSLLTVQWTNQHGCGGDGYEKQNCIMVLQYMCQKKVDKVDKFDHDTLRNGFEQTTPKYTQVNKKDETVKEMDKRKDDDVSTKRGLHEPWQWYDQCYKRERNLGLFTADQVLKKNKLGYSSAIYTRENPGGTQRGYECPEERDYYPYWHPTPWKDIAILADKSDKCQEYTKESFNVQKYGACVNTKTTPHRRDTRWNNPRDCKDNAGQWVQFANYLEKAPAYKSKAKCQSSTLPKGHKLIWAVPYDAEDVNKEECLVKLDMPDCVVADRSRSNHLGDGADATPHNYTWELPHFPSGDTHSCVLRVRYNVSTDDYDPYNTDAKHNGKEVSPVVGNPYVNIGRIRNTLRLNINTNQYGRIFQDRSHVFELVPRPPAAGDRTIYNLNVRGKRGNIVQVYPAVEYDFYPKVLQMTSDDLVHVQWTGSNSHNNGNPAGDGQAGNDGQGKEGTDRSNMAEIHSLNLNYPIPFEHSNLWNNSQVVWIYHDSLPVSSEDLAVNMVSSGYYKCLKKSTCGDQSSEVKAELQKTLDNSPASYAGVLVSFKKGTYHYMCTRNNNFTNRSQKGTIIVK